MEVVIHTRFTETTLVWSRKNQGYICLGYYSVKISYNMEPWAEASEETESVVASQVKKTAAPSVTTNRYLIQTLETIVSSYEMKEKYSTKLTAHSLYAIEQLIKTKPEFFRGVESTFLRNINDGKIQSNEVPYIIALIMKLYNLLLALNIDTTQTNETPADTCGFILKFVFSVIIREHLINVDNDTEATLLILCCDNIIDACVNLLKLKPFKPLTMLVTPPSPVIQTDKSGCCCW